MDKIVFKVMLAFMLLYLFFGQILMPREVEKAFDYAEELDAEWTWLKNDGTKEAIEVPGSYDVEYGEVMRIQTTLPDNMEQNAYIRIYSLRQDLKIYVDGKLREEYSTRDTRKAGTTSSACLLFIEMFPEDSGKELVIEYETDSSYSGELRAIYYGEKMELWSLTFRESGPEVLVAILSILLGVGSLICSWIIRWNYKRPVIMEYLGWSVTLASAWIVENSMFRQLVFPNLSVASDVTFYTVMILPMPFLIYFNGIQKKRYGKLYSIIEIAVVAIAVICSVLHVTGLLDYSSNIIYSTVVCVFAIILVWGTIIRDVVKGHIKEYMYSAIGICGASLAIILQFALYYLKRDIPFSGTILSLGLIFLLLVSAYNTIRDLFMLEKTKTDAIMANQAKERFLANVSHEIRTPINAVLGLDEMILRESKEPATLEYAEDIQSAGRSLLAIINDLLDFSKMESGKMEIVPVEYYVSDIIKDCYHMIELRAEKKGLRLVVDVNDDIPGILYGDELRIRQIVMNLLTNAVKYTKSGTVTLSVNYSRMEENQIWLIVAVKDTGIGIAKEHQAELFDVFQRVDMTINHNEEGTGLGLPVTKQLVELMQGGIHVDSVHGMGSTFTVRIPQKVVSMESMKVLNEKRKKIDVKEQKSTDLYAPNGKILVVDDMTMNLKVFAGLLKDSDLQIDTADGGATCLALLQENTYDMIFLDHMMPDMDGVETLEKMQNMPNWQDTPVIMLTANAMLGAKEEYLQKGFADYMAKPIQVEALKAMVKKYLSPDKLEERPEEVPASIEENTSLIERLDFLDTKLGLSYCAGNRAFYEEMVVFYVENHIDDILNRLYEKEEWKNYHIKVHAVKTTSLNIGALQIAEQARKLEEAAKTENDTYIREHHNGFLEDYRALLEKIQNVL